MCDDRACLEKTSWEIFHEFFFSFGWNFIQKWWNLFFVYDNKFTVNLTRKERGVLDCMKMAGKRAKKQIRKIVNFSFFHSTHHVPSIYLKLYLHFMLHLVLPFQEIIVIKIKLTVGSCLGWTGDLACVAVNNSSCFAMSFMSGWVAYEIVWKCLCGYFLGSFYYAIQWFFCSVVYFPVVDWQSEILLCAKIKNANTQSWNSNERTMFKLYCHSHCFVPNRSRDFSLLYTQPFDIGQSTGTFLGFVMILPIVKANINDDTPTPAANPSLAVISYHEYLTGIERVTRFKPIEIAETTPQ